MKKILELIESDALLTAKQLSMLLDMSEEDIKSRIADYEKEHIILGRRTLINWDKVGRESVSAFIELKVSPQPDCGFDKISQQIVEFPEVKSVYLMSSSSYDLLLTVEGKSLKEVAYFVSYKLAPLENVISTSTHFILKKYKDSGILTDGNEIDERENVL